MKLIFEKRSTLLFRLFQPFLEFITFTLPKAVFVQNIIKKNFFLILLYSPCQNISSGIYLSYLSQQIAFPGCLVFSFHCCTVWQLFPIKIYVQKTVNVYWSIEEDNRKTNQNIYFCIYNKAMQMQMISFTHLQFSL